MIYFSLNLAQLNFYKSGFFYYYYSDYLEFRNQYQKKAILLKKNYKQNKKSEKSSYLSELADAKKYRLKILKFKRNILKSFFSRINIRKWAFLHM